MQLIRPVVGIFLLLTILIAHGENHLLVGLLEDVPPEFAGASATKAVRFAFEFSRGHWKAFPAHCPTAHCLETISQSFPTETTWTISDGGHALGEVKGTTPPRFPSYASVGRQEISDPEGAPSVGEPDEVYGGFLFVPAHRPLIATSDRRVPTPSHAGWAKVDAKDQDIDSVWPEFSHLVPVIDDCARDAAENFTKVYSRSPKKEEVEILAKWNDRSGNALLRLGIQAKVFKDCDGPSGIGSRLWLYRSASGAVHALPGQTGQDGVGIALPLGFLDLVGDGQDEALFLLGGYNQGGYALYYDNFQKFELVSWSFH